ncbi:hypothetical protein [Methylobacter sp.]|uniref:hypothetical protein n=1 Tax=Methylobacter sp. TaxID=2051955 RepID=UPI002FDEAE90
MSMLLLHTSVTVAESPASAENKFIQDLNEIVVQNIKDPAGLSYRQVLKALDAYDKHHGLAPFAPARFKVQLNRKQWDASRKPLTLRLVSSNTAIDIPVAADKTFSIPRNRRPAMTMPSWCLTGVKRFIILSLGLKALISQITHGVWETCVCNAK